MLSTENHPVFSDLCELGLCDQSSLKPYYQHVRDRDDVSVLRCERSGVLLLSQCSHIDTSHYEKHAGFTYWNSSSPEAAVVEGIEDLDRRSEEYRHLVANKRWLDIGTGVGGILTRLGDLAEEVIAVEPQAGARTWLRESGYRLFSDLSEVPDGYSGIATAFHVFEHVANPLSFLRTLRSKMAPAGLVAIEVPHARDFLLSFLDLEAFKRFTFWSEHVILHTRLSLEALLRAAGFGRVTIRSCQRYPLANHLHWLSKGAPGGHRLWPELRSADLDRAYEDMLANLDMTDTLIALARAGS